MVQINFGQREVSCKIVFYGPGMSGKTTNLEIIHQKAPKQAVGEMVSIATETDRTLYFDFMPMDLGQVAGMHTKFMLYTVPGQIYYNATRKLVLQGVDGVIFVADSSPDKMPENLESIQNLRDNLAEMGLSVEDIPVVIQYNKRDLPGAMSVADLNAQINPMGAPTYEAVARDGKGVFATLKEVSRLIIEKLNREHAPAANRRRTQNLTPPNAGTAAAAPSGAQQAARPPAPPPLPKAPPPPPPPPMAARGNSGASPVVPPPRPQGSSGAQATTPARPAAPPSPPQRSAAPPANPRDKHLAKAKPQPLASRAGGNVSLGNTDPNLKRYQEQRKGGAGKIILWLIIAVVVSIIIFVVLAFFVPAVAALLPRSMQERIEAFKNPAGVPPAPSAPSAPSTGTGAIAPKPAEPAPVTEAPKVPAVDEAKPEVGAPDGQ